MNGQLAPMLLLAGPLMMVVGAGFVVGWKVRGRAQWRWFWAGAAVWAVGVALKVAWAVPLNRHIIGALDGALPRPAYLAVGSLYIGLLTGVFEIGVTLLAALIWRSMARAGARAVAVGIGAGGSEAVLLGAATLIAVLVATSSAAGSEQVREAVGAQAAVTS
ncbi:MAG: YhfC family glutamic-type intramembrane protease, partial [Planctomycetota bacterium]